MGIFFTVKLLSRNPDGYVFLLESPEHRLILELLGLRGPLLRRRRPRKLSRSESAELADPGKQLGKLLTRHRQRQFSLVERLLTNPKRCVPTASGFGLTLKPAEFEALLQALNDLHVRIWEKLGCPDLEAGDPVEYSGQNLFLFHLLHLTNLFQTKFLEALLEDS